MWSWAKIQQKEKTTIYNAEQEQNAKKKRPQVSRRQPERHKSKKETSSDCFGSAGTRTQAGADLDRMVLTPSPATTRRHTPRPHHRGGTLMEKAENI
jgi:hypothetical protein